MAAVMSAHISKTNPYMQNDVFWGNWDFLTIREGTIRLNSLVTTIMTRSHESGMWSRITSSYDNLPNGQINTKSHADRFDSQQ
jgi:hypothetical protein